MPAVPVRAADGTERVKSEQRVLRGWKALRNKFLRSAPGKRIPVQTELLLDGVRVVRNDFQEANETSHPMVQSLKHREAAQPRTRTVAGQWWMRVQMRLFAERRKQS